MPRSGRVSNLLTDYEKFLLIDHTVNAGERIRLRAIYVIGWAFIAIQILNLLAMTMSYGRWTYDHTISVCAIVVIFALIHALRIYRNFIFYSLAFIVLIFGATLGSALPESTGINSALIPFVVMSPFIGGFVAGWRMSVFAAIASTVVLSILYYVSMQYPAYEFAILETRNFHRYVQALFALALVTPIAAVFSATIFRAFRLLEESATAALAADQAKTEFLANMSHELRTPLSGVLGLSDTLKSTSLDAHQSRLVARINEAGQMLLHVLNDILDLSKINAGKLDLTPEPFSPRVLARKTHETWIVAAEAKGLAFDLQIAADAPQIVVGDERRLRQILFNLLSNAIKFTRAGRLSLSLEAHPGTTEHETQLVFTVADTGVGISKDVSERIYEAFEQGDVGIARNYGGTGLGLSVSQRLARLMGGEIAFRPNAPQGTVFTLRAPVYFASKAVVLAPPEHPSAVVVPDGLQILVVEDDQTSQFVIFEILSRLNADVDIVETARECLQRLDERRYDLILMDKRLPGLDGFAAAKVIRKRPKPDCDIPIIAVTAEAMTSAPEDARAAGMDGFIAKPIRSADVGRAIQSALQSRPEANSAS